MDYKFKIEGLDCVNCALELEEELEKIVGVKEASVSFINQKVYVSCDENNIDEVKDVINNFEEVKIIEDEKIKKPSFFNKDFFFLAISLVIFLISFILVKVIKNETANLIIEYVGYLSAYLIVGYEVLYSMVKNIFKGQIFDENFLMGIASIGAILITIFSKEDYLAEAFIVMFLYQLGEYLQELAADNSRKDIADLVNLKTKIAHKLVDGKLIDVEPDELKIGDIIEIRAGENVPCDGKIVEGSSNFDTKSLTGEALPKYLEIGSEILAGYNNIDQIIKMEVLREEKESAVSRILNLVENSMEKKGQAEKFITKFARWYTPIVTLIAFIIFLVGVGITIFSNNNLIVDFTLRALKVLVVSCPCALVISIPLTYFGAIGTLAKRGVLVKGAINLDNLYGANVAYFDKTGTLTKGEFKIVETKSIDEKLMSQISQKLEYNSKHPISLVFDKNVDISDLTNYKEELGFGISALIENKLAIIGNRKMMDKYEIKTDVINSPSTILYVAYDNNYLGYYLIDDTPREGLNENFILMKNSGIDKIVLLTGDNKEKALAFAKDYSFDEIKTELLPEDKYQMIDENVNSIYVGDGINDVLVMNKANTAFSMGKLASEIAIENSDIILIDEDLKGVNNSLVIAKRTRKIIIENIIFSILVKVVLMILGAIGIIPLWTAVLGDVGVMLIAVLNSLRIKKKKNLL